MINNAFSQKFGLAKHKIPMAALHFFLVDAANSPCMIEPTNSLSIENLRCVGIP